MDPISLEDLALLEVLLRIDEGSGLTSDDSEIRARLLESGLAAETQEGLCLTTAGIELCKSLQHRKAADEQAARIRRRRKTETDDRS